MEATKPAIIDQPKALTVPTNVDPEKEIEFARRCANALLTVIQNKKKPVTLNGEQYIEFEDWQTIGRFYQHTVGIEWTKAISGKDKIIGYGARAVVYNKDGLVVSSAEAQCTRQEQNWERKPDFQIRSMAQTRASAKALRNVFSWVVVLAGIKPTPAEEIEAYVAPARQTQNLAPSEPEPGEYLYVPEEPSPAPQKPKTSVKASDKKVISDAQLKLIKKLIIEKKQIAPADLESYNSAQASKFISELLSIKSTS